MRVECIESLETCDKAFDFVYEDNKYSFKYYKENGKRRVSVCKNGKELFSANNVDEAMNAKIGNYKIEDIFSNLPDKAFDIFDAEIESR